MYTVSKGPSKIVAKTRRGLSQNYEKFETIKESSKKTNDLSPEKNIVPRPVFQTSKKSNNHSKMNEEKVITPQHEEIINYINESWNIVVAQNPYDSLCGKMATAAQTPDTNNNTTPVIITRNYQNKNCEVDGLYQVNTKYEDRNRNSEELTLEHHQQMVDNVRHSWEEVLTKNPLVHLGWKIVPFNELSAEQQNQLSSNPSTSRQDFWSETLQPNITYKDGNIVIDTVNNSNSENSAGTSYNIINDSCNVNVDGEKDTFENNENDQEPTCQGSMHDHNDNDVQKRKNKRRKRRSQRRN